jgi:uncharacterized protein (TIGR03435 family)
MKLIGVGILATIGLFAQSAFEVATVKLSGPQSRVLGTLTYPGGRVLAQNRTLAQLMEEAFNVQAFQISSSQEWEHEIRYDVEAKPPADSKASKSFPSNPKLPMSEEQREMLQSLLAERFHLKYHRETRQGPVYLLIKTNKKLMLQPAKDKSDYPWVGGIYGGQKGGMIAATGVAGINAPMELLATRLSQRVGKPVLDRTGLSGSFDFEAESHADESQSDLISSILSSVQELGLKLVAAKGPTETIVVDHAEKPQEN